MKELATANPDLIGTLRSNMQHVIIGKPEIVSYAMVCLLAGGHLLLEDVPGVGKTTLARAMARSLGSSFKRIQFTSDMLPSDVLGVNIFNDALNKFEFVPGPIFAGVVLADEINRTTPRTQSALLQAMDERRVTIDNQTHTLPLPFMVIATQNPLEFHGTYPLPESQMDRFLLRVSVGYPSQESELEIIRHGGTQQRIDDLKPVLAVEQVLALQAATRMITASDAIMGYLMTLVWATREHERLELGASPRGSIALFRAAQARAFLDDRDYLLPDDVKQNYVAVLSHRVIPRGSIEGDPGARQEALVILSEILDRTPIPE